MTTMEQLELAWQEAKKTRATEDIDALGRLARTLSRELCSCRAELDDRRAADLSREKEALKACAAAFNRAFRAGEFSIEYDVEVQTVSLFLIKGERSVLVEKRVVIEEDAKVTRDENSITYAIGPSVERIHEAFLNGEDCREWIVANAVVDDLVVALEWLAGKRAMPPGACMTLLPSEIGADR